VSELSNPPTLPDLHTLLIANRGEIALRVMRTARRMGIRTVAIFTETDRTAPHVRAADRAIAVPSYLDIDAVVGAALAAGADAIHPGYGFLSERAPFARAVQGAGLVLVGPPAAVMDAMGRKDAAREIAVAAGVPVVPRGEDAGYPVLVKAAAGGGGKGMRIVRAAEEYDEAVAAARREALSAFGDDTMLVERYVEHGRHIEVQIMADAHGGVVHLHERDCSSQRRHQKVIEEAPAPTITPEIRELVTSSAVALARHVGYRNAGTVEFLVDDAAGHAYFLEMNTRLQVEHPVTEAITGLDLVELQLLVAAGRPLPIAQSDVTVTGHAIEARVYAEDSFHGFLPQAGVASVVRWPAGVRVDQALDAGQVVSTSYDPMLGKIIAHGADREAARRSLLDALDDTAILGLTTNTGFLRALIATTDFRDALIDTAWLDRNPIAEPAADLPRVFAAWTNAVLAADADRGPFRADGWRSGADPAPTIVELDRMVAVDRPGGRVDDLAVREISFGEGLLRLEIDGAGRSGVVDVQPHRTEIAYQGQRFVFTRPDIFGDQVAAAGDGVLTAPMPGTVIEVRVANGDHVDAGQVLLVLEAMKMELALKAPFAGTVGGLTAAPGTKVALGAALVRVGAAADAVDESAEGAAGADPITAG
jgi:3-methylcrotonyl-CoA carboxylase alpha subunit/acetyl-CoA/propionyl-CoA carboxylase biotin carboxyl carrier protein